MESLILAVSLVCALAPSTQLNAAESKSAPSKIAETKAEYVKKAHAELNELSGKIDALELKAKAAGSEAREGMDKKLAALKAQRKTAKRDFAKLRHASGKAWISFKAGVDDGINELKKAYDEAAKD
ncbi:MAG: hypothetical protein PHS14_01665 [Elusimicrobia bacterium]|nr:hypothetical protein [Elusimicrobiota bacterium]